MAVINNKCFIVIVTYNGIRWLKKYMESTVPYPVIIVDNNSNDGTIEFIQKNYPATIFLPQNKNIGFGKANNIGISYALKNNADFVFLLNQDAKLNPNTLQTLLQSSLENPEFGIISPLHFDKSGRKLESIFSYYIIKKEELLTDLLLKKPLEDLYEYSMINAAAWLIPKRTLKLVGGFNPIFFLYGEDDNYCQRVRYHGLKIGVCPKVSVIHDSGFNYHKQHIVGSKEYYYKFLNQIKVIYGNVNSEDYKEFYKLKFGIIIQIIESLLKLQIKKSLVEWRKLKLIWNMDFDKEIKMSRKSNAFLDPGA